jgi:3-deoxy-D-manno-octulosonic-acid transferase
MHCASLGEFEQGRPLLEKIKEKTPHYKILLTFFSPSGYEAKKDYTGADYIFYLPADSSRNAEKFLNIIKPCLVLWVKYEYWYYYLFEIRKREVPLLLVSGIFREGQPFFKWYGGLHRRMLACFDRFFVQTPQSQELLATIGFKEKTEISGDTRFDRVIEIAAQNKPMELIDLFCRDFPVLVAGSTWEEDEEELDHFARTRPDIRFIIAPHEVGDERVREIETLFVNCLRYSTLKEMQSAGKIMIPPGTNTLIIDNIGMLASLYRYGRITYVGGGFGDDGVHNVLEAAVYGKPVIFGPVIEKYIEAIELAESGGGFVIESALEAEKIFTLLLGNEDEYHNACRASIEYVNEKKGATDRILKYIYENRLLTN